MAPSVCLHLAVTHGSQTLKPSVLTFELVMFALSQKKKKFALYLGKYQHQLSQSDPGRCPQHFPALKSPPHIAQILPILLPLCCPRLGPRCPTPDTRLRDLVSLSLSGFAPWLHPPPPGPALQGWMAPLPARVSCIYGATTGYLLSSRSCASTARPEVSETGHGRRCAHSLVGEAASQGQCWPTEGILCPLLPGSEGGGRP